MEIGVKRKWHTVKPVVTRFFFASLFYLCLPSVVLLTDWVEVTAKSNIGHVLIIVAPCFYLYFAVFYLWPGCLATADLITNSFVERKMAFLSSSVDEGKLFGANRRTAARYGRPNDYCFHAAILADHKAKEIFTTTFFHLMEKDKRYTILYGKRSRVIISILSEEGKEMLLFNKES